MRVLDDLNLKLKKGSQISNTGVAKGMPNYNCYDSKRKDHFRTEDVQLSFANRVCLYLIYIQHLIQEHAIQQSTILQISWVWCIARYILRPIILYIIAYNTLGNK